MKRIIVLLLILFCFQTSDANELSVEEQQLAWEFIYDRMLPKEYLPTIYKEDIIINLKGNITAEDSTIVAGLISNFQKAIPHLKIELSNKKGNLILGLDEGTNNRITSGINDATIHSQELYFPANFEESNRKKFIYFQLFRSLIFYKNSKKPFIGLDGCAFAEENFESISFSKFDFFILEKLYSPDFSAHLLQNLPDGLKQTAWNSIRAKFVGGESKEIKIYKKPISIRLNGFTKPDSIFIAKLVNELESIIPQIKIGLTGSKSNLTFNQNQGSGVSHGKSESIWGSEIKERMITFSLHKDSTQRQNKLYRTFYRSLVKFSHSENESTTISGCVFDEASYNKISFHPLDKYILLKLYANDFEEQLRTNFLKSNSLQNFIKFRYSKALKMIATYGGIILALILLSVLILFQKFNSHHWNFKSYLKQTLWVILAVDIYHVFNNTILNLRFFFSMLEPLIFINTFLLAAAIMFFIIEKGIDQLNISDQLKTILKLSNTFICIFLIFFLVATYLVKTTLVSERLFSVGSGAFIVTTIRFFLFSLSIIKQNEIKQKDIELVRLSELHKQAELQSLQSKINPHFLYNALNSIASLAKSDGSKTEQMALALSDFFKYSLNKEQKEMVCKAFRKN